MGLSRPDIALQESVHRLGALQVVDDFLDRLLLACRELERQHLARRLADAFVDVECNRLWRLRLAPLAAARQHAHLETGTPLRRSAGVAPACRIYSASRSRCASGGKCDATRTHIRLRWQVEATSCFVRKLLGKVQRQTLKQRRKRACAESLAVTVPVFS